MPDALPKWIDGLSYDGLSMRRGDILAGMHDGSALGVRAGVRPGGSGLNVTLAGTTITVAAGVALVQYQSGQGVYRACLASSTNLTLSAAHATLSRIDLVYLRVWDTLVDASGQKLADVVYLPGTAASSPVAPVPAGTQIYIPLATITVPPSGGGSASVSTSVLPYTVAPGGILPSASAPATPYVGQFYDNGSDLLRWNGSGWDTYQKVVTTAWNTPALATGFSHDGNGNGTVQYRKVTIEGTQYMEWRGGLGITYASNAIQNSGNFLQTPLAASFRPPSLRSLTGPCSASSSSSLSLKLDFKADGTTQIVGTTTSTSDSYANPVIRPPWVSLNGLRYAVS
ncbi:hypothetical protein [Streptomyces sp. NPDC004658]|uniref:hypothetical protein n=1 Tax=Streptomyces sp. NPDC004658 TaxID=3154672 RepID=UPI0033BEAC09